MRAALRERDRLNRFGVERLDPARQRRREHLNDWYRNYYRRLTTDMENARERGDKESYKRALEQLDAGLASPSAGNATRGRSGPSRPRRPRR